MVVDVVIKILGATQHHKLQLNPVSNDLSTTNGQTLPAALFEETTCVIETQPDAT